MPFMRSAICSLVLCGMVSLAVAADKAAPAEKRFALPAGKSLVIKWTAGWADIAPPPGVPTGTAAFSGPDASKMRVLIIPIPADANFTSEPESLRSLARNVAQELEKSGKVDTEQQTLEGANVRGFYVKGTDLPPKPGEFSYIYSGSIAVGTRPFVFQILWNAGGEAAANKALAALRTLRIQKLIR